LRGVTFCISGIPNPLRTELREKATSIGAKYSAEWTTECSHLICDTSPDKSADKYRQAKNSNAVIVSKDWIIDSFITKIKYSVADYLVDNKSSISQVSNNKDVNHNANNAIQKIFDKNNNQKQNPSTSSNTKSGGDKESATPKNRKPKSDKPKKFKPEKPKSDKPKKPREKTESTSSPKRKKKKTNPDDSEFEDDLPDEYDLNDSFIDDAGLMTQSSNNSPVGYNDSPDYEYGGDYSGNDWEAEEDEDIHNVINDAKSWLKEQNFEHNDYYENKKKFSKKREYNSGSDSENTKKQIKKQKKKSQQCCT